MASSFKGGFAGMKNMFGKKDSSKDDKKAQAKSKKAQKAPMSVKDVEK